MSGDRVESVSEIVAAIEEIILDKLGANVLRSGYDGSFTSAGGKVARMIDDALTSEAAKALTLAANAMEVMPPLLRAQYVATLRLYASEPWRLGTLEQTEPTA